MNKDEIVNQRAFNKFTKGMDPGKVAILLSRTSCEALERKGVDLKGFDVWNMDKLKEKVEVNSIE